MICKFKEGEKVVCIRELFSSKIPGAPIQGHVYIVAPTWLKMGIINNEGSRIIPNWDNFITLKEYRKRKLNKINEYENF